MNRHGLFLMLALSTLLARPSAAMDSQKNLEATENTPTRGEAKPKPRSTAAKPRIEPKKRATARKSAPIAQPLTSPPAVLPSGIEAPVEELPPADQSRPSEATPAIVEQRKPGEVFRDCADCPELVVVPSGNFVMGAAQGPTDERPPHKVSIAYPLAVGRYEVSMGEYIRFVDEYEYEGSTCHDVRASEEKQTGTATWRNPGFPIHRRSPVTCVSWDDAKAYIDWLNRKTGQSYRLLTEAEWEYVARAGSAAMYPWGERPDDACRLANTHITAATPQQGSVRAVSPCYDTYMYTAAVGSFQPNAYGLHDLIGNVWEWTEDCYSPNYTGAPGNGAVWEEGDCSRHVARGGGWFSEPAFARSAMRYTTATRYPPNDSGFRIARPLR